MTYHFYYLLTILLEDFILCVQIALCQNRYTVVEIDLRHPCPPKFGESVLNNYKHTEIVFFRIQ